MFKMPFLPKTVHRWNSQDGRTQDESPAHGSTSHHKEVWACVKKGEKSLEKEEPSCVSTDRDFP